MVQWVEPLLLAVYGAADSEAVCDGGRLVEGSYRTMNSGWGIPGTTDVRTFGDVGTGRFAHSGFDWLLELVNDASAGLLGCEAEGMGADIRTKSSSASAGNLPTCQCRAGGEDPAAAPPALPPMEVGDGIEIRVFDNFPVENIKTVYRAVALLAEASRQHHAEDYVYGHPGWKVAAQAAMREGWNAVLGAEYVGALEKNLNVDLSAALRGNSQAFLVFSELCAQLSSMHEDGFWTGLFLDDVAVGSTIHNPNRASWVSEPRWAGGKRVAGRAGEWTSGCRGLSTGGYLDVSTVSRKDYLHYCCCCCCCCRCVIGWARASCSYVGCRLVTGPLRGVARVWRKHPFSPSSRRAKARTERFLLLPHNLFLEMNLYEDLTYVVCLLWSSLLVRDGRA